MAQDPNRVIAGSRAQLRIEDVEVGRVTDFRIQRPYINVVVEEMGDPDPVEIECVGRGAVTLTAAKVVLDRKTLDALGIVPRGTATKAQIIDFGAKPIVLYDDVLDRPICRVEGCKIESEDFAIAARTLMTSNAMWRATRLYLGDDA